MASVDEKTKEQIRQLVDVGFSWSKIAQITGVSRSTVSRVANNTNQKKPKGERVRVFPSDLRPQWEALNKIGREYREKKNRRLRRK